MGMAQCLLCVRKDCLYTITTSLTLRAVEGFLKMMLLFLLDEEILLEKQSRSNFSVWKMHKDGFETK